MAKLKDILQGRKDRIEQKLKNHGIIDTSITFLRYLMYDDRVFATPYKVGCRIIILYGIIYTIEEPTKKQAVAKWLKRENLWTHTSSREQQYLEGNEIDKEQLNDLSWQIEGAYILAWALNLVKEIPSPSGSTTDKQMEDFFENIAPLGESLDNFLSNLSFRNTEEIFEENIFYELTTAYFRDLLFNGKNDTTDIDRYAAFERHKALNWLRRFMDIKDWEHTETST